MNKTITADMLKFKEAVKQVWNQHLRHVDSPMSPQVQESYEAIELELLAILVLRHLDFEQLRKMYRRQALPISVCAKHGIDTLNVQFGARDANNNMVWQFPTSLSVTALSDFKFIEFFDWDPYSEISLDLVKAINSTGQVALFELSQCDFEITDSDS